MKRRCTLQKTIARGLALLALVCACATAAAAQNCQDAGLQAAVADTSDQTISLILFPGINSKDQAVASDASQWTLVDIAPKPAVTPAGAPTPPPLRITQVELAADRLHPDNFLSATIHYVGTLERTGKYILSNVALTFNGCSPPQPPSTRVLFDPTAPVNKPKVFTRTKAKNRDEADIYISGQLEGSRQTRAKQTADIKVELPFSRGNLFGRQRDVIPFFHLKASNSKKSDADSLDFGAMLRTVYNVGNTTPGQADDRLLRNLAWETEGKIEADRRFGNINALWGNRLYFLPRVFGAASDKPVLLYVQPFIGGELGGNLKSPLDAAEHRGLARATGGANLYLNFNSGRRLLDALSFEADYIRRWPLRREVTFTEDDKGNLLPLVTGRRPRDYITSKIDISVNDYFSFSIGYDYGRLPPNYKLVDSHFTFGITYKQRLIPRIK
jgi:hypothetical protein